jgi:hypothetical protein
MSDYIDKYTVCSEVVNHFVKVNTAARTSETIFDLRHGVKPAEPELEPGYEYFTPLRTNNRDIELITVCQDFEKHYFSDDRDPIIHPISHTTWLELGKAPEPERRDVHRHGHVAGTGL